MKANVHLDQIHIPQNTYPVHAKHCQYKLYTCNDIVGLHCSCNIIAQLHICM